MTERQKEKTKLSDPFWREMWKDLIYMLKGYPKGGEERNAEAANIREQRREAEKVQYDG